jgi:hypothetical protein
MDVRSVVSQIKIKQYKTFLLIVPLLGLYGVE